MELGSGANARIKGAVRTERTKRADSDLNKEECMDRPQRPSLERTPRVNGLWRSEVAISSSAITLIMIADSAEAKLHRAVSPLAQPPLGTMKLEDAEVQGDLDNS